MNTYNIWFDSLTCHVSKVKFSSLSMLKERIVSGLFIVWMLQNQIMCFKGIYSYVSIGHFRYIKIQHMARRLRGHIQRKLNDHVCSFLLFVSSRPHYFNISIVAYWYLVSTLHHQVLIKCWPSINRDVDRVLIRSFDHSWLKMCQVHTILNISSLFAKMLTNHILFLTFYREFFY